MSMLGTDLTPVLQRLDALATQVAYLAERQRAQEELFAEMTPIAREVMGAAIARLDALDKQGYFAFAGELAGVGKRIVEGFSPADVRQLGDAIVGILETVRTLTQPEILQVAADASAAMQDADQVKPLGIFGMVRATKNDDVQKGMALMVEVLRRVGHGVNAIAAEQAKQLDRKAKLAGLLGPRRSKKALGIERPQLPAGPPACAMPAKPAATAAVIDGIAYGADGHLVDPAAWSRPLADAIAQLQGVALTSAHWPVIDAARADFAETKVSPNIRRLTQITGAATKDLYALFPKAPGRTIAKIAGLPKPAGCL
jgi:TusE/DsrC/DsvC family sulfur relay protein